MNQVRKYHGVDVLKFVCAFMVIGIHTIKADTYGIAYFLKYFGRVAVPLFAVSSGYFISNKLFITDVALRRRLICKYVLRLLGISVLWNAFYLALNWKEYIGYLSPLKTVYSIMLVWFFRGLSPHLWYLSALIACVVVAYVLTTYHNTWPLILVATTTYLFALLCENYYGLIPNGTLRTLIDMYQNQCGAIWNSWMSIFAFFVIGILLKRYGENVGNRITPTWMAISIVFLFTCMYCENIALDLLEISVGSSNSFVLLPLATVIFVYVVEYEYRFSSRFLKRNSALLSEASLYVYLLHFALISPILRLNIPGMLTNFALVSIVSGLTAVGICYLRLWLSRICKRIR